MISLRYVHYLHFIYRNPYLRAALSLLAAHTMLVVKGDYGFFTVLGAENYLRSLAMSFLAAFPTACAIYALSRALDRWKPLNRYLLVRLVFQLIVGSTGGIACLMLLVYLLFAHFEQFSMARYLNTDLIVAGCLVVILNFYYLCCAMLLWIADLLLYLNNPFAGTVTVDRLRLLLPMKMVSYLPAAGALPLDVARGGAGLQLADMAAQMEGIMAIHVRNKLCRLVCRDGSILIAVNPFKEWAKVLPLHSYVQANRYTIVSWELIASATRQKSRRFLLELKEPLAALIPQQDRTVSQDYSPAFVKGAKLKGLTIYPMRA